MPAFKGSRLLAPPGPVAIATGFSLLTKFQDMISLISMDGTGRFLVKLFLYGVPLLFAVVLHEVAHGWVAYKKGDPTAKLMGRLTLNPIHHIDPVGTVLLPILELIFTGRVFFGWARPVPVNFALLRNPKKDMVYVAAAGPASNILQAIVYSVLIKFFFFLEPTLVYYIKMPQFVNMSDASLAVRILLPLSQMAFFGMIINLFLAFFNLLPIPPLDGSRILVGLGPPELGRFFNRIEPYGMTILLLILFLVPGLISAILTPIVSFVMNLLL